MNFLFITNQHFRLKKENVDKEKVREQETSRLHQTQKFLKQEQRKLKQVRVRDYEDVLRNALGLKIQWSPIL